MVWTNQVTTSRYWNYFNNPKNTLTSGPFYLIMKQNQLIVLRNLFLLCWVFIWILFTVRKLVLLFKLYHIFTIWFSTIKFYPENICQYLYLILLSNLHYWKLSLKDLDKKLTPFIRYVFSGCYWVINRCILSSGYYQVRVLLSI